MLVPNQESEGSCLYQTRRVRGHAYMCFLLCIYDFPIEVWNYSDGVVIVAFDFIGQKHMSWVLFEIVKQIFM